VVHAANPPGYKKLARPGATDARKQHRRGQAARRSVVLPGTVYNFGPDARRWSTKGRAASGHAQRQNPRRDGATLEQAARDGVPVLVVRAGDFFGPHAVTAV